MAHAINLTAQDFRAEPNPFFTRIAREIADFRRYVAIRAELDALSDRDLADIGLSRHNLRDVAREAAYGA